MVLQLKLLCGVALLGIFPNALFAQSQFSDQMRDLTEKSNAASKSQPQPGQPGAAPGQVNPTPVYRPNSQLELAPGATDLSLEMAAYQANLIYNHCASKDRFFKQRHEPKMGPAKVVSAMTAVSPDFEVLDVDYLAEEHLYAPAVAQLRAQYKQQALNFKNSFELSYSEATFCQRYEPGLIQLNEAITARYEADKLALKAIKLIKKIRRYPAFAKTDFRSLPLRVN